MALSGSAYTSFHRHRLVIEWSATQSVANNSSTVTAKVYLQGMDAYSAINAPATNSGSVTVNGTTRSFTANSNLSAYQKKLLTTQTFTVGHNNDGSKSFSFSTTYNVNATLSGTFHGNKTASGTGVLNNIPRHSSLNAIPTFTIPNNSTFSITRQSSSFTHNLTFWVAKNSNPTLENDDHWQYIKSLDNVATSGSFSFTPAEFSTMLGYMGTSTSWKGKIKLWTNGISGLSHQRYMYIIPPTNSQATGGTIKLIAGQVISGSLSNFNSNTNFSYDLTLKWGNWSKAIATNLKSSTFSYTLTQADVDTMLSYVKNAKSGVGNISTWSKYNGSRFRTEWGGQTLTGNVDEDTTKPLISKTATYADTNTASVGITGSNQAILQGQSVIEVKIPSGFASPRGSATLTNISASIGGSTVSASYTGADQTLTISKPNSASNTSLVITITDSRGFTESQSMNITVYPYSAPNVGFRVTRLNGFQEETDIRVNSTWSPVNVGGVNKNTVSSVRYRTKKTDDTTWSGYTAIPVTTSATAITSSNVRITLDNSFSWNVELSITDKLGTYTNVLDAPAGKPIMFLDAETRSVVIGALPTGKGRLEMVGGEASFHAPTGIPSIYLNNGDIAGVNGIWFGPDKMDNLGEGLHFLTTAGEAAGDPGNMSTVATTNSYYDTIYWRDKTMYWDNSQIITKSDPAINIWNPTGTSVFSVGDDGAPRIWAKEGIYDRTYGGSANMQVTANGTIGRITSASKYKLAISEIPDALDLGERLLTLNPKRWFDKNEAERYADILNQSPKQSADFVQVDTVYGLIAEDLRNAGLDKYVMYDPETKELEGIAYDRLWTVLIPVIRKMQDDIIEQKILNAQLMNKLGGLQE